MPKGGAEKPKGPQLLEVAEVARRLGVQADQVENWLKNGMIRGDAKGIRPYDFKKFQLDNPEEIKRAKKEALQGTTAQANRKPKKGFISKFKSLFGGGKDDDASLAKENKRLKDELTRLRKSNDKGKGSGKESGSDELEKKLRYLEGKLSETRALESEVTSLRKQLAQQAPPHPEGFAPDPALARELEQMRAELAEAKRNSQQGERFREALSVAQQEREQLLATIEQMKAQPAAESPVSSEHLQQLQVAISQRDQALAAAEEQVRRVAQENEELKHQVSQASAEAVDDKLVEELLELQRINLERFKRLRNLYEHAANAPSGSADTAELEELRAKYNALVADQPSGEETREMLEQLSQARGFIERLREENGQLKRQLEAAEQSGSRVKELEAQLQQARESGAGHQQMEAELSSLRKAMDAKENQMQKVASRLTDNEKRLAKAMGESARLTELLIERENRLRELSEEFEQEYRDKLENLDRQVSGLQWKLSLREERIAHLESELQRKGG